MATNKPIDAMATIASMLDIPQNVDKCEFLVEQLLILAFEFPQSNLMCEIVGPNSSWYQDIYNYLKSQTLPLNLSKNQCRSFIHEASRYIIINDTLYHHSFDQTLLGSLDSKEAQIDLHEVYYGIYGGHLNGLSLAKKLTRVGYYWPTMEQETHNFAKNCYKY